jgi:hypothetical protein
MIRNSIDINRKNNNDRITSTSKTCWKNPLPKRIPSGPADKVEPAFVLDDIYYLSTVF